MVRTAAGARQAPGPIPHTLSDHLCIDFVNSRFTDHTGGGGVYDRLELAEWRAWFAARCGVAAPHRIDARTRQEVLALRALLRRLLASRRAPGAADLAALNRRLGRPGRSWALVQQERRGFALVERWQGQGWPAVMAAVAASYATLLAGGGLDRVRVCANPDCSYMFFDDSRNTSRRWCDVAVCGNLLKVRRYRATTA